MSETLQQLFDQRAQFLAFVQRRVADAGLAEDILQAAYVRALEKSDGLREQESAVGWFYRVLRNAVVDHYRRSATESSAMGRWAHELGWDTGEPVVTEPAKLFICGCIEHVLPSLRPAYAEILREVDLAEQPLSGYAERHGLTPTTRPCGRIARERPFAKSWHGRGGACSVHACLDCVCKMPDAAVERC